MNNQICLDFDGVIHAYRKGWQDGSIYDEPNENAIEGIRSLIAKGYKVFILTARKPEDHKNIIMWLKKYMPETIQLVKEEKLIVTNVKPIAMCYVDDRAILHVDWRSTLSTIEGVMKAGDKYASKES